MHFKRCLRGNPNNSIPLPPVLYFCFCDNTGTLVTTVVASDKDGDNVLFGFVNSGTTSGMFQIEERTGVIRLIDTGKINLDR